MISKPLDGGCLSSSESLVRLDDLLQRAVIRFRTESNLDFRFARDLDTWIGEITMFIVSVPLNPTAKRAARRLRSSIIFCVAAAAVIYVVVILNAVSERIH